MATSKSGTVKETGAKGRDVLIGMEGMNRNLQIRVHEEQQSGLGGRVEGHFELLHAGNGYYSDAILRLVRPDPYTAEEFISLLQSKTEAAKCSHVLNRNALLRVWLSLPEATGEWLFVD